MQSESFYTRYEIQNRALKISQRVFKTNVPLGSPAKQFDRFVPPKVGNFVPKKSGGIK